MRPRRGRNKKEESCRLSCAEEGLLAVKFINCYIGMFFKLNILNVLPLTVENALWLPATVFNKISDAGGYHTTSYPNKIPLKSILKDKIT